MHLNQAAALGQGAATIVVLTSAIYPTGLGFIRGPFVLAWGGAYIAACLTSSISPSDIRANSAAAGLGISFWVLRSLSLLTVDPIPWVGVVNPALIALMVALYYWRSLARVGFLNRLDEIEARTRG